MPLRWRACPAAAGCTASHRRRRATAARLRFQGPRRAQIGLVAGPGADLSRAVLAPKIRKRGPGPIARISAECSLC